MAATAAERPLLLLLLCSFLSFTFLGTNARRDDLQSCKFDAVYQFGDSISDTGNLIRENPSTVFARLPYGETFCGKPTGRCSNGLLMIDYFTQSAGVPFLEPYLNSNASFAQGANFAVAGATALSSEVLAQKGIRNPLTNTSLSKQLDWMSIHFNATCSNHHDCSKIFKKSLILVGEIGGNDYNYPLLQVQPKTIEEVKTLVPEVVEAIKKALTRVIDFGATRIIIPGNFPIGCLPVYLTSFQTNDTSAYDKYHCLRDLNTFSIYHNNYLKQAIKTLRKKHPTVSVVYADYYNAFIWLLNNAKRFGLDTNSVQKACCGTGGNYNYNRTRRCGLPGVPVCSNPDQHVSWDGVHLTQQAYKILSTYILNDISPKLEC